MASQDEAAAEAMLVGARVGSDAVRMIQLHRGDEERIAAVA
jgi:hypothetical protein